MKMEPSFDDEHVMSHLLKFVCGIPTRCHHIRLVQLYGNKKPSELFQQLEEKSTDYVFTQLKKTSARGKNYKRSIVGGGGSWKVLDKSKPVFDKKGCVIGFKKSFRFDDTNDHSSDSRIVWSMKEYSLNDTIVKLLRQRRQIRHEDYVVCRITKTVNSCASSQNVVPLAISGENSVANVTTQDPLMLGHLNYVPTSCLSQDQEKASVISWAPSPVDQFQFQENQESELSNFWNENECMRVDSLLTEESNTAPLIQLPLISTEEAECSAAVEPTLLSPFNETFEPLTEEELAIFDNLLVQAQKDQETASVVCRITKTVNLCARSQNVPLAISGDNSVGNVMSQEPQMLGHLNYVPTSCLSQDQEKASIISWTPSPVDQFQFQENQESELSNFRNENECISVDSLLAKESNAAPLIQLPLISTEEAECSAAVAPTYTALPSFNEPFEPLTEEDLAFFDKSFMQKDQETASVRPKNDIATYHKELDAYAAEILKLNPPLVPDIPQYLEDECPLFPEDFYIGPTALWS